MIARRKLRQRYVVVKYPNSTWFQNKLRNVDRRLSVFALDQCRTRPALPLDWLDLDCLFGGAGDQITLDAPSHIVCTPYVDAEHWSKDFNDQLYERNTAGATWTHLQVKKSQILKFWPRPEPVVRAQNDCGRWLAALMRESPNTRPQPKMQYWTQAKNRFRSLTLRQFKRAWDNSISESGASSWAKAGRPATKSNQNTK